MPWNIICFLTTFLSNGLRTPLVTPPPPFILNWLCLILSTPYRRCWGHQNMCQEFIYRCLCIIILKSWSVCKATHLLPGHAHGARAGVQLEEFQYIGLYLFVHVTVCFLNQTYQNKHLHFKPFHELSCFLTNLDIFFCSLIQTPNVP